MSTSWQHIFFVALALGGLAGPIRAADLGRGNILFEWFEHTAGGTVDQLIDGRNRNYPDNPSSFAWLDQFASPTNRSNNFGTRVRGYLYPPADGDYTFWIRGDDHSRLYLSTDDDPANKKMLCEVVGSTGTTEWTKYPAQKSNPVALKAGKKYYIEALHRDGTGGDHVAAGWGGPTIGAGPVIIAGSYLSPFIRPADLATSKPSPADGEEGVALALLTWTKGLTAVYHNVYFGTDPQPPFVTRMTAAGATSSYYHPAGIEPGVTYYWKVDETDMDGVTVYQGAVWSFTAAPLNAWGPVPSNGSRGVATDVVPQWNAGRDMIEHDVYFGDNHADVAAGAAAVYKGRQVLTTLNVGAMKNGTAYYWRVDEIDATGAIIPGEVWSFRTVPVLIVTDPSLLGWWKLDEAMGTAIDYSGHDNHGEIRGGAKPVAGFVGGAIDFDGFDDFIYIGKTAADLGIEGRKPKSVTAWVYTRAFNDGGVFDMGARTNGQDFCFRTRTTANQWRVQYYGTGFDHDFTYTSQNVWVHFALVYDGAQSTCYANGVSVSTAARTLDTSVTNPFQIGAYGWQVNFFNGLIDDVRLYNKALAPEEVLYVYQRADPTQAWRPSPTIGKVTDALQAVPLTWTAGDDIMQHDVYLGTDSAIVQSASASDVTGVYRGRVDVNSYTPDPVLDWNDTYYWRVDEVLSSGDVIKGRLWNFRITDWLIIDDFESYTDNSPNKIFQTWLDGYGFSSDGFFPQGYGGNGTNAAVGHDVVTLESPYYNGSFAERGLRHGGAQSMPLYYDATGTPYDSETERTWTSPQDWTVEDVNAVVLHIRGNPRRFVKTSESSFSLSGAGVDIWGTADQFRYAYKTLNGDGTIVARVLSNGSGTNRWTKGGVMIRQNNTTGSINAMAAATGGDGGGFTFQWRVTPDTAYPASSNTPNPVVAPPVWIKLVRVGNSFSAYFSRDGVTWVQQGTAQTVAMTDPVMIGVAVTSHAANQLREFEFDNITTTGKVTGDWIVEDIGIVQRSNEDAMPLYVGVQDSSNRSAVIVHPDANILLSEAWSQWKIPLTAFTGVNMKAVKKIFIGVGDRKKPQAGGAGLVYIDNVALTRPAPVGQ